MVLRRADVFIVHNISGMIMVMIQSVAVCWGTATKV